MTHTWDVSPTEAIKIQNELRKKVIIRPLKKRVETIAGADISFNKYSPDICAGIIVFFISCA
jgi:deoxyribonuclease V